MPQDPTHPHEPTASHDPVQPQDQAQPQAPANAQPRRRDAARTRKALLHAARRRFVIDGYERTTLRDVAAEAGVNLALVKRYFGSKAGLFEAVLTSVPPLMPDPQQPRLDATAMAELLCRQLSAESWASYGDHPMLLFLRTAGDERTDAMRLRAVQEFSEHLLHALGVSADGEPDPGLLLRAQLVVALASGITVLRSTVPMQPLCEATAADLLGPLTDAIDALLVRALPD